MGYVAIFFSIWLWAEAAHAGISAEQLFNKCGEQTLVTQDVKGKVEIVGEKLGGYCQGYLSGVYSALVETKTICAPKDDPTSEYLKSVFDRYYKSVPPKTAEGYVSKILPAAAMLHSAYSRAFPCKSGK